MAYVLMSWNNYVGADLRVCPKTTINDWDTRSEHIGSPLLDYSAMIEYIVQISIGGLRRNRGGRTYVYYELD